MNRGKIYVGILVTILIIAQFIQMTYGAGTLFSLTLPTGNATKVYTSKTDLLADLSGNRNSNSNFPSRDSSLTLKGDIYLFFHEKDTFLTWLQAVEDLPKERDSIPFHKTDLHLSKKQLIWADLLNRNWVDSMEDSLKNTEQAKIILSKKELIAKIKTSKKVQGLVSYVPIPQKTHWLFVLFASPIFGPLLLFLIFLFIWGSDKLASFIGGVIKQPKWLIIGILFSTFILWDTWRLAQSHYNSPPIQNLGWSSWLTGQTIVSLLYTPGIFLFFFLKKRYFHKMNFADREAYKFGYIFILWTIFNYLHSYFGAQHYISLDPSSQRYIVWMTPQIAAFALLLATGNFFNNFRKHYSQLKAKEKSLGDAQKNELKSEAALATLQSRVNPHFLYNSLNSIASLAQKDALKTEKMALALSKFYKYSTNRQEEHWATIAEELALLDTYLEIEKIRFGNQLITHYQLDTNLKNQRIPRFLLQPLVENAIKYGYNEKTNKIVVTISITKQGEQLEINIKDTGNPFSESMELGYGLRSVQQKLKLLYPIQHQLDFINQPEKGVFILLDQSLKTA